MAKNYIDNLSEEVVKGQTQKAESGIFPGSRLPLGYKMSVDGDKIVPVVDEANKDLPIKMFEYYATGFINSLDCLEMPQDAVDYVAEGLKQSLYFKRSTVDRTRVKMEVEKSKLQNRLSVLYEDKLDRNISEEFYNQKFEEYSKKLKTWTR